MTGVSIEYHRSVAEGMARAGGAMLPTDDSAILVAASDAPLQPA